MKTKRITVDIVSDDATEINADELIKAIREITINKLIKKNVVIEVKEGVNTFDTPINPAYPSYPSYPIYSDKPFYPNYNPNLFGPITCKGNTSVSDDIMFTFNI